MVKSMPLLLPCVEYITEKESRTEILILILKALGFEVALQAGDQSEQIGTRLINQSGLKSLKRGLKRTDHQSKCFRFL